MITMIVIALALGALALLYSTARSLHQASSKRMRPVDVTALRTLMDREDEEFLRNKLPRGRFTHLKRRRILVTFRYEGRISANSAVVMPVGESAGLHPETSAAQTADPI